MASSSDPDEVLRSTSGKANFQRVARLLISGGTTLLREIFDLRCPPINLPTILKNPAIERQLKTAKLTGPQWDCLYPSPGVYGKSTDFDVTLLYRLLRTICNLTPPATGWDALPTSTDHSLAADLARMKYYRNSVYGHVNQKMEITNEEFPLLWQEISDALMGIAQQISPAKKHEWQLAIINFLKNPLTPEHERNVQELLDWYRNDTEVKESIEELKSSTQEVQSGMERLETAADNIRDQLREEAQDIKDQLGEVKHRLSTSGGGAELAGVQLQVKIDFKPIPDKLVAPQGPQAGAQETAMVPIASGQPPTEATGVFGVTSSGNPGVPSPQEVLSFIAFKVFQPVDPSKPEELNGFLQYMEKIRNVLILDVQSGSLIITVECSSLEILDGLWHDYCTGYLDEMAQKHLVTKDILKELGLTEVKLSTTILNKDYRACQKHLEHYQSACLPRLETRTSSKESDPKLTTGGIHVFAFETVSGKVLSFDVLPSNTVREVKNTIHEKVGIPVEELRLFCAGKPLADGYTMTDLNFRKKSTLDLAIVRLGATMEIYVKTPNGDTITLTVFPEDSVLKVKKNLANKAKIPVYKQCLAIDDKELGNLLILSDFNIQKESVLHLARLPDTMPIHVRVSWEKTITLDVHPSNTVAEVKAMIAEEEGIPTSQQRICFDGKQLQDHHCLSDYNIVTNSGLRLYQRIG